MDADQERWAHDQPLTHEDLVEMFAGFFAEYEASFDAVKSARDRLAQLGDPLNIRNGGRPDLSKATGDRKQDITPANMVIEVRGRRKRMTPTCHQKTCLLRLAKDATERIDFYPSGDDERAMPYARWRHGMSLHLNVFRALEKKEWIAPIEGERTQTYTPYQLGWHGEALLYLDLKADPDFEWAQQKLLAALSVSFLQDRDGPRGGAAAWPTMLIEQQWDRFAEDRDRAVKLADLPFAVLPEKQDFETYLEVLTWLKGLSKRCNRIVVERALGFGWDVIGDRMRISEIEAEALYLEAMKHVVRQARTFCADQKRHAAES